MAKIKVIYSENAPEAIGPYSQAVRVNGFVYLSGQIPLNPQTLQIIDEDISGQAQQVFTHLAAVADAAGGSLADSVKINISLTDIGDFDQVNKVMEKFFSKPYPARACVQVTGLPRGANIEVEAILYLENRHQF